MVKIHKFLSLLTLTLRVGILYVVDAIKSTSVTNMDATPIVLNPAWKAGGRVRKHRDFATLATAAAEAASTLRFCRLKSNDVVTDLVMDATSFGTGCTMDIGIYRTAADGGAVRDADFFASAVDMAAAQRNTNVLRESGVVAVTNMAKPLWEQLGYTVDPQCDFDVVGTLVVAATVAGSACVSAEVIGGH